MSIYTTSSLRKSITSQRDAIFQITWVLFFVWESRPIEYINSSSRIAYTIIYTLTLFTFPQNLCHTNETTPYINQLTTYSTVFIYLLCARCDIRLTLSSSRCVSDTFRVGSICARSEAYYVVGI